MNAKTKHQTLLDLFDKAPIKHSLGIQLEFNDNHQAICHWAYKPDYNHALKGVHGGILATLLDNAGWFTAAAHYGQWVVTVEFQTRLLEGAQEENLYSIGKMIRAGKRLSVCQMEVFTEKNHLVATGSGTFAVTSKGIS